MKYSGFQYERVVIDVSLEMANPLETSHLVPATDCDLTVVGSQPKREPTVLVPVVSYSVFETLRLLWKLSMAFGRGWI